MFMMSNAKKSLQSGMSLAWIGCAYKADETFALVALILMGLPACCVYISKLLYSYLFARIT